MPFPVDEVRRLTPGVRRVIHLNNAGSALPPSPVVDVQIAHLRREAEIGGYEAAMEAGERISAVYSSLGRLIGAAPNQIAVVENATRAWDMGVYGYPFRPGDRVLTGRSEYASNVIALLQLSARHGVEIAVIEDDEHGQISLEHLRSELEAGAAMVALTHVPTNGGLVNPAEAVGDLCAEFGVFYVLDACQSAGQIPVDVTKVGCDLLSATGRKYLRGPRGTGFLYVSERALETITPPFLDLHAATWTASSDYRVRSDARRFENWETNYAGKLGLGAAVDYALALGVDSTWARISELAALLRLKLESTPRVELTDKGLAKCGIVTFVVEGESADRVQTELSSGGINVSTSPAAYALLDLPHRGLDAVVRASVHYYNSEDEIERLCAALRNLP